MEVRKAVLADLNVPSRRNLEAEGHLPVSCLVLPGIELIQHPLAPEVALDCMEGFNGVLDRCGDDPVPGTKKPRDHHSVEAATIVGAAMNASAVEPPSVTVPHQHPPHIGQCIVTGLGPP